MRCCVASATFAAPLRQRDAVETETPHRTATACSVGVVPGRTTWGMFPIGIGRAWCQALALAPRTLRGSSPAAGMIPFRDGHSSRPSTSPGRPGAKPRGGGCVRRGHRCGRLHGDKGDSCRVRLPQPEDHRLFPWLSGSKSPEGTSNPLARRLNNGAYGSAPLRQSEDSGPASRPSSGAQL